MPNPQTKINRARVRMYRMGTGDCFVIKFFASNRTKFTMMIDSGAWQGSADHLQTYIKDLKKYVNNHIDLLVVTHEHKDHVLGFQRCQDLFTDESFTIDRIWLGWSENDSDDTVREWKDEFGQKKRALAMITSELENHIKTTKFKQQFDGSKSADRMIEAHNNFSQALSDLSELHFGVNNGIYVDGLAGMKIVKEELSKKCKIHYCERGDIETIPSAPGLKFYVLGPPDLWSDVKKEKGKKGESYQHNKDLGQDDAFTSAALAMADTSHLRRASPFDRDYFEDNGVVHQITDQDGLSRETPKTLYENTDNSWRRIDVEWMHGAGSLALRINSRTNNLSLALAIEFEDSGRVMLFPGDAEYGSWKSWHDIEWGKKGKDGIHLTEDLLNRTVFYKVAHHLSHNGTAQKLGLEMMTSDDLVAMATLDYNVISTHWTNTMPNRAIIKELLKRAKGRLMIMNEEGLFYNKSKSIKLTTKIEEARSKMNAEEVTNFQSSCKSAKRYLQYTLRG